MNPLISVIIPVYKVEEYLGRCVQSVFKQTYQNLEIILVDDGSPDQCPKLCDEYAKKDSRVKVIHKENGGLSDARNFGIQIARGEYITFLDSDDWISDNCIQVLYENLVKNDSDISIIDTIVSDGTVQSERSFNTYGIKEKNYKPQEALKVILCQTEFNTSAWGKLYKRQLFSEYRFTVGILYEDLDLIYRLFATANKISYTVEGKYYYFQRTDSIMHQKYSESHYVLIDISQRILQFVNKNYPELRQAAECRYVFSNFLVLSEVILDSRYKAEQKRIQMNVRELGDTVIKNPYINRKQKIKTYLLRMGLGIYRIAFRVMN